jgi:uncharacterized protein
MMSKRIFLLSFLISLLLAAQTAFSLQIPEKPTGRVSDYAGLLTNDQKVRLDAQLQRYEEATTNQIAVAIFKSLEGESLEDFSIRLAEKWKIGTRKDNGVILIVFLDDRKIRIEVGYGLEGSLTDATSSSIIRNDIAPHFRQGDYYYGIEAGVEKIIEATKGEYKAEPNDEQKGTGWKNLLILAFLFIILPFFGARIWAGRRRYYTVGSGGWGSGGNYSRGGSSGGGFSGGGGSFGGGGASGGW